jgi:hypothetical protein
MHSLAAILLLLPGILFPAYAGLEIRPVGEMEELACRNHLIQTAYIAIQSRHENLVDHAVISYPGAFRQALVEVDSEPMHSAAAASFLNKVAKASQGPATLLETMRTYNYLKQERQLAFCTMPRLNNDGSPMGNPRFWTSYLAPNKIEVHGEPLESEDLVEARRQTEEAASFVLAENGPRFVIYNTGLSAQVTKASGMEMILIVSDTVHALRNIHDTEIVTQWAHKNVARKLQGRNADSLYEQFGKMPTPGVPSIEYGFLLAFITARGWDANMNAVSYLTPGNALPLSFLEKNNQNIIWNGIANASRQAEAFLSTHEITPENLMERTNAWLNQMRVTIGE